VIVYIVPIECVCVGICARLHHAPHVYLVEADGLQDLHLHLYRIEKIYSFKNVMGGMGGEGDSIYG
jgi:hypothetical protein